MRYDFEEGLRLYSLDKLEVFHERSLDTKVGRHLSARTGRAPTQLSLVGNYKTLQQAF